MKVIFYKGRKRLFDRAVADWTRGKYSHCEAVVAEFPDGSVTCWSASFMDKGIRPKTMILNPDNWDTLEIEADVTQVQAWFASRNGTAYDWWGLMGFIFRPIKGSDVKQFCSGALAASVGLPEPWRFDPNTLHAVFSKGVSP